MDFGEAIRAMKDDGASVARSGWNGKNMFIYIMSFPGYDPCIVMHTAGDTEQPGWLASQADMLAEDWNIVAGSRDDS